MIIHLRKLCCHIDNSIMVVVVVILYSSVTVVIGQFLEYDEERD